MDAEIIVSIVSIVPNSSPFARPGSRKISKAFAQMRSALPCFPPCIPAGNRGLKREKLQPFNPKPSLHSHKMEIIRPKMNYTPSSPFFSLNFFVGSREISNFAA